MPFKTYMLFKPRIMNISIEQLQLFTLNVGYACHNGDWNWKDVRSPFARLYLVTEGTARISLPKGDYQLTPGNLYFIPPFVTHSYQCDSLFTHYYIHIYEKNDISPSILEEFDFPVETPASPHDIDLFKRLLYINPFLKLPASNPKIYDNQSSLISNIELNLRRPFCDKVESRGILYILFSRFLKRAVAKADTSDSRILQAVAYIRRHLNVPLDVNILAHDACMSKDHFIRVFRQETGDTPKAYVIKKKMESAEQFIVTSDRPIKEIARMVGYDDYSHFNKAFKAFAGVTPATYREQHRE